MERALYGQAEGKHPVILADNSTLRSGKSMHNRYAASDSADVLLALTESDQLPTLVTAI